MAALTSFLGLVITLQTRRQPVKILRKILEKMTYLKSLPSLQNLSILSTTFISNGDALYLYTISTFRVDISMATIQIAHTMHL
jgi:hypothetical protein